MSDPAIVSRERLRAALERALTLDPQHDREAAERVVAQTFALTVEQVREALGEPLAA